MIISFNGSEGAGKTTIAKKLADKLGWDYYYIGGIRRKMAKKRGLTLEEYNKLGETDPSTDLEVDEYQKKLGKTKDNFVIEGRTSWYFIPHSLKIYIDVKPETGAERIYQELQKPNSRNEAKGINSLKDVMKLNKKRQKSDNKRYWKYFKIKVHDKKHFDYILDTTNLTKKEAFDQLYNFIKEKRKNKS